MQEVSQAAARAAAAGVSKMPEAYSAAISAGGEDLGLPRTQELQMGPAGLLVLALVRMPDLFLHCNVLEACNQDPSHDRLPAPVIARTRILTAAALRLTYRALESHTLTAGDGSEVETAIHLTDAYTRAAALLQDVAAMVKGSVLLAQAQFALWALGDAASATGEPNPAVLSERLVDAIAARLALFIVATQLSCEQPALRLAEA